MLTIRQKQMESLERVAMRRFKDRVFKDLRSLNEIRFASADDDHLQRVIEKCVDRALQYGLTTERHLLQFVLCVLEYGEDFEIADPLFQGIFADYEDEEEKIAIRGKYLALASSYWNRYFAS